MPVSGLDRERGAADQQDQSAGGQGLTISLLGGVTLHYGDRRVILQSRKAEALLGYLALSAKQRETRERIVGLLWSETEESKARASLRQVLKILRSAFDEVGFGGFSTDHTEVSLDADAVDLDVRSIAASVATGRLSDLLLERPRITDSLLAGYDDIDPSFRSWLLVYREGLHQKLTRGLEDQLADAPFEGSQARRLAEALIHLDATHEGAYQRLIRSYADAGDVAGALAAYKKLWELLGDEYDMEPSDKTQAFIAAIKGGTYRTSQPMSERPGEPLTAPRSDPAIPIVAPPAALPDNPPLKLLLLMGPFDVTGLQPEQRHIGRGFRYELITRLIRFREWSLIDAASGSPASQDIVALRPHYTISANFLQDRDKLSVVVTLKAGDIGAVVWSDRYSFGLTDFFDAQQGIMKRLAMALNVHLSVERLTRLARAPDISLEVFDRWLRGQSLLLSWNLQDRIRATELFESITRDAPNFAPAYSGLVQMVNTRHTAHPGLTRTPETRAKALSLAKTAVQLDPLDSRAQLCLAWAHAMNSQFDLAEVYYGHACDLNENDPWTRTSAALGFACCDQLARARQTADRALELSPQASPLGWSYHTLIRFLEEDYEGSLRAAERAGDAFKYVPGFSVASLALLGRVTEARAEAKRFLQLIRGSWFGEMPPQDEAIARWILEFLPIRSKAARDRLREGLAAAGIPTPARSG
jgi:DNA-binding SARP family transcriptional activator/TolB-like protein